MYTRGYIMVHVHSCTLLVVSLVFRIETTLLSYPRKHSLRSCNIIIIMIIIMIIVNMFERLS